MGDRTSEITPGAYSPEADLEKRLRPRTLDEFVGQQKIKDNLSVFLTAALQRGETLDHVLLSGPPGLGKCIAADSLVLTEGGYVRMGDLVPTGMAEGEARPFEITVYGIHGLERTSHVYYSGYGPARRVRTSAGFELEGTPHHRILAASTEGLRWKRLEDLVPTDHVAIAYGPDQATKPIASMAAATTRLDPSGVAFGPPQPRSDAHAWQLQLAGLSILANRFRVAGQWQIACDAERSVVPHAATLLSRLEGSKTAEGVLSRDEVVDVLARIQLARRLEPAYRIMLALSHEMLFWDRVADVQVSEAETYDFVVPGTHSFVANGFFNHNTTLGYIIAEEMGAGITTSSGPVLDKPTSMAGILTNLNEGDVLFVDEIHRLGAIVEEYLYSAMEDYYIDIVIDSGPNARSVKITLPPFTLVGATTRKGLLTAPLRARFGIDFRYDYYSAELLTRIVTRSAGILGIEIDPDGALEIARRSRGTPRIANRLLRRARDFADVKGTGRITCKLADHALTALEVDQEGLDDMDARILTTLIDKFGGGPAGLTNLAVSVGEDAGTIEEVYEPYLIQEGYLQRTPRGRVATPRSYRHFGISEQPQAPDLFE